MHVTVTSSTIRTKEHTLTTRSLAGLHKIFAELTIISVLLIPVVSLARVFKLVRVHTVNVPAFDLSSAYVHGLRVTERDGY